ncbi:hypothetical protein KKB40_03575 [Patescibacteria group bacterium]|nr:hypothetical protein [Patescibacteria group bacterium]
MVDSSVSDKKDELVVPAQNVQIVVEKPASFDLMPSGIRDSANENMGSIPAETNKEGNLFTLQKTNTVFIAGIVLMVISIIAVAISFAF